MGFESTTAILSSSEFKISLFIFFNPNSLRMDLEMYDIKKINGLKTLINTSNKP